MGLKENKGQRFNQGKLKWSLVDFTSLESTVRALELGSKKYDAWNWTKGLKVQEICESLLRHALSFLQGEDVDAESGLSHMGHVICNAMFIEHMMKYRPDMDDRYPKELFGLQESNKKPESKKPKSKQKKSNRKKSKKKSKGNKTKPKKQKNK